MNTLLLGGAVMLWAAIHSWLASDRVKEVVIRMLGAGVSRVYRLVYNVFSFLALVPIALLMHVLPDHLLYRLEMPWAAWFVGGQALAVLFSLLALLQTDMLYFTGISQLLGRRISTGITTTGFYRLVRHPLYLFGLLILWLTPIMTSNLLTVSAVLTIYLFIGARLEERRLVDEFGTAYEEYRLQTPMIVPGLNPSRGIRRMPPASDA
jgi:protein-S-isoprenylcysteine O-methyltransferase Ste14